MSLAMSIKHLRERAGLSPAQLATKVGVSQTCVWNWEQGNTHPRPHNAKALAVALGVTTAALGSTDHSGPTETAEVTPTAPSGLDAILEQAKAQIAAALNLPKDRVQLSFSVAA